MTDKCRKETQDSEQNSNSDQKVPGSNMLPFKIGFFTYYGCVGIITYFLPLYLKQLGFTPRQIGIVTCFRTLGSLFGVTLFSAFSGSLVKVKHLMFVIWLFNIVLVVPFGIVTPSPTEGCVKNLTDLSEDGDAFSNRSWMFKENDVLVIFIIINVLAFSADFMALSIVTAVQGGCMIRLGKGNSGSYGQVRSWGAVAQGMAFLAVGVVVSGTTTSGIICGHLFESADYHFMFHIYASFGLAGLLNSHFLKLAPPADDVADQQYTPMKDSRRALSTLTNTTWLIVQFCRSMFFSVTHGFLNWHIENLGATPMFIGSLNSIVTLAQFVGFFCTPKAIQLFGHSKIVCTGLLGQVGRFLAFSLITNPVYILPVLIVEGLMLSSAWSATASYLSNQVSEDRQTEVQGIMQTVHCLGKAAGFLLSGCLTQAIGAPGMFLVFSGVAGLVLVFFLLVLLKEKKSLK